MHAAPGVSPPQSADRIGPVGLGGDPLPINPSLQGEQGHMDQVGKPLQIGRITASTNETHEGRHIVDVPDTEARGARREGIEHHRQLKLPPTVGFCTPPLTWRQLLRATQGKPIRLIPRCVIQQSSGKQRIIDNAHIGGQSAFSSESTARCVGRLRLRLRSGQGGPPARQPGRRRGRLAERLPVVSNVCGRIPGLRRLLASSRMGLLRTSCTQGSSLACPWPLRLSTGTPDSAKPWDADSCSFLFLSTSTTRTSPIGPRAKGPGSRPFGT